MRKKRLLLIFIAFLFLLTGCRKALKAEEAAQVFVERFVYEKKDEEFIKNFTDGEELDKELKKVTKKFQNNLIVSFNSLSGGQSLQDGKKIVNNLMKKVKEETSYKVKDVKKINGEKKTVVVTFEVTGLNFDKAYKKTMSTLIDKMLKDPKIAEDEDAMTSIILTSFNKEIEAIDVKKKPVPIYVKFRQEKKRWMVVENQTNQLTNLYVAFIAGVRNEEAFSREMSDSLQEVLQEAEKRIEKEDEKKPEKKNEKKSAKKVKDK